MTSTPEFLSQLDYEQLNFCRGKYDELRRLQAV